MHLNPEEKPTEYPDMRHSISFSSCECHRVRVVGTWFVINLAQNFSEYLECSPQVPSQHLGMDGWMNTVLGHMAGYFKFLYFRKHLSLHTYYFFEANAIFSHLNVRLLA